MTSVNSESHIHKVERLDENAAQKISNSSVLILKKFNIIFYDKIVTFCYELQPIQHKTSSQRQNDVHMMSPTTHTHLMDAVTTSCGHRM